MHIGLRRQPAAVVEELGHALRSHVVHGPTEPSQVLPGDAARIRPPLQHRPGRLPVHLEVLGAARGLLVDPRNTRHRRIDSRGVSRTWRHSVPFDKFRDSVRAAHARVCHRLEAHPRDLPDATRDAAPGSDSMRTSLSALSCHTAAFSETGNHKVPLGCGSHPLLVHSRRIWLLSGGRAATLAWTTAGGPG